MFNLIHCLLKVNSYACPVLKYQSFSCMSGGERRKELDKIFFYFKHWSKTCLKVAFQCSIFSACFVGSDLIRVIAALNSILENTFYFICQEQLPVTTSLILIPRETNKYKETI